MGKRKENKYLQKAIASYENPLFVVSPDLKILAVNVAAAKLQSDDVIGKKYGEAFPGNGTFCSESTIQKALEKGQPIFQQSEHSTQGGNRVRTGYCWPIHDGDKIEALACTTFDLPDTDKVVRKMELANAYLLNLIQSTADGVVAADRSGRIRIYNQNAEKIFGYTAKESLAGMNIRDFYPEGQAREIMSLMRSDKHGGKGKLLSQTVNVLAKDKTVIPVNLNAAIIYERGREVSSIGFFHDQRDEIHLREELERSRHRQGPDMEGALLGEIITGLSEQIEVYNLKFGEIAVNLGMISQEKLDKTLKEKEKLEKKSKMPIPIGRVMIKLGYLSEAQRQTILEMQSLANAVGINDGSTEKPALDPDAELTESIEESPQEKPVISIVVADDKLQARVEARRDVLAETTAGEILQLMAREKIVYGTVAEAEIKAYLDSDPLPRHPLVVAEGTPAIPPSPPKINYQFDTDPMKIGKLREDGTIDWKDRGEIPQAEPGDLLAEIKPGDEGSPGKDIFGSIIPIPIPEDTALICGEGVELSKDGLQYIAKIQGHVKLSMDGELSVFPGIRIDGDVGNETGHVDFVGHIDISGMVQKGFSVKGKSLKAGELQGADIVIENDVDIIGGIYDSNVKCGGHLKVSHVHNSTIDATGDLVIKKEIFDSDIETRGRCDISRGTIVSTRVTAFKGVIAQQIGTGASSPSTLKVGFDYGGQKEKTALRKEETELAAGMEKLVKKKEQLEKRSDQINDRLGKIAQKQDKLMVQQRRLEEAVKKQGEQMNEDKKKKLEETRQHLATQKSEIDVQVEELMAEDEENEATISRIKAGIHKAQNDLDTLQAEIGNSEDVEQSRKNKALAMVQVSGAIMPKTSIKGPKASIRLEKPHKRVQIHETGELSEQGRLKWIMDVSPLR